MTTGPGRSLRRQAVRFQLTSLLDLLLIVVFAQFLEMRQSASEQASKHQEQVVALRRETERSELAVAEAQRGSQGMAAQLDRAMQVVQHELLSKASLERSPREPGVDDLRRQLAAAKPSEVLRFLVGYDELLKRAEVWDLHADGTGMIAMSAGEQTQVFRLEANRQAGRADEFATNLYRIFKQLPQPKGLVVILVSYDLRTTAGIYQAIIDGMPAAVQRLRQDAPNVRFEYTVLGPTDAPIGGGAAQATSTPPAPNENDDAPRE